jgi:GT2 family glycosyltransferase
LNPDTIIPDENVLKGMVKVLDRNAEIGAVGPKVVCADGKTIQLGCARTDTNLWTVFSDRIVEKKIYNSKWLTHKYYHTPRYVSTLSGSCMMFKSEVSNKIGLMDEQFFMFLDDVDYCKRVRDAGWKVHYMPTSEIMHFGGESSAQNLEKVTIEMHRSLKRYFQKHFGICSVLLLDLIMCLKLSSRLLKLSAKCMLRGNRMDSLAEMRKILGLVVNVYIRG